MEDQLFFVGQKAFIEKDGQVLILHHENGLDFPGGKINQHTLDFIPELQREVREETNLEIEVGDPFVIWHTEFQIDGYFVFLVGYKCKYISGDVKISDEHTGYQWVNENDYNSLNDGKQYFAALRKYFETK